MGALAEPVFIQADGAKIISEMVADYENRTGIKLSPGQAEMLLINAFAYRELLIRNGINAAAKQNLVAYASYPALDYLGELVGVNRLDASKAVCTITFQLIAGHGVFLFPEDVRVQSTDGKVVFVTLEAKQIIATDTTISVAAECTTEGLVGNDYKAGDISIILDPQAYVASAANSDITSGGADPESDEQLRARIKLAPSTFSNAGSRGAYEYFAKSAHPAIIDVAITSPVPGQVNIYPLLTGGVAPSQEVIDAVFARCNADRVRPLTDTVVVAAPEVVNYNIVVNLVLLTGAITTAVQNQVQANLTNYTNYRKTKLGVDVVKSQIVAHCNIDQVYSVEVVSPAADLPIDYSQVANCTGITVNITGVSNE